MMPQAANPYKYDFQSLALTAKESDLEIGDTWTDEGKGYSCCVKRIDDDIYKICFHTHDEESDEESDEEDEDEDITCDQCEKKFPEKDTTIVKGWDWCPDCVKGGESDPLAMD